MQTEAAYTEVRRSTGFLLGLVVVLSALFVALEWNTGDDDIDIDEMLLDDVAEELLVSAWDEKEQVVVLEQPKPTPAPSEQIKVVDVLPELPPEAEANTQTATVGETEDLGKTAPDEPLPPVVSSLDDEPLPVRVVEQLPEYPGGMGEFVRWLSKNLQYPASARQLKQQGRVVVSFIVNRDGTISDAKIARSASSLFNAEAMRVIRMMPRWKPGVQGGKPCRTMVAVPIVFEL